MQGIGISGRIAKAFITSKLTPLLVLASLLLGAFAVAVTPREEEPQIVVPMVDVFVAFPGASAKEVETRVTAPMEQLLWEIKGVEYVYSIAQPGGNLTIVRFYVGEDMEDSLVKLYNKLMSNYDRIPQGVSAPMIKARGIDDVPVLSLTLWGQGASGYDLRRVAQELHNHIKQDADVSEITITGGQRRQVRVELDSMAMTSRGLAAFGVLQALQSANVKLPSGSFNQADRQYVVETGGFLASPRDIENVVIGAQGGRPVYLRDIARITDGPEEPSQYVMMGHGAGTKDAPPALFDAVTIAVAKKVGANASVITERAIEKVNALKGTVIPSGVNVTVTRDYGETAKEKSDELLKHMLIATVSVIILIALTLGWRESIVVAVAVPVTLALTLLITYLYGYTLNRVTLFALIFSIGILVDDAIVVVENIHRHFKMSSPGIMTAIFAVDEVGNPTILATFTVIAALLPMAFVSGLMGPYMRPIPVGASAAMLFSLAVAFIVSPWLGYKVLKNVPHGDKHEESHKGAIDKFYERALSPLIQSRSLRYGAFAIVGVLLLASMALVPLKAVAVKMLPFDNKSELQVIIDMPEGTTLERTNALARELGTYLQTVPEVRDFQSYVGASAPFNFNGLVRHYFMRKRANEADIQVNLVHKEHRAEQSHAIAKRLRPQLQKIAQPYGANVKIAEIPPGPPVLSTLVAEVYGPDPKRQEEIAGQIKNIFSTTPGVVDVDWYIEEDQPKLTFEVDKQKAAISGVDTEAAAQTLAVALAGAKAGLAHMPSEREPVDIQVRLSESERSSVAALGQLRVHSRSGQMIPLSELVRVHEGTEDRTIYHKNLRRVTYVIGDVAGLQESPVYAIQKMKERVALLQLPEGYGLRQYTSEQPWREDSYAMKWDGEWHITYEVFRDMGIAFAAVLVLIYVLVVAWFRSFVTPLVIMSPIPLTLVGILPGHWMFGAFFTATSMIGFIALAGIIVRNSILLVDFIELEWKETGDLPRAILKAGAVRFRPIVLTAAAVVVGSFVMLFDPIFQGLAIAMMFGAVAATGLTLAAVPLAYYEIFRNKPAPVEEKEEV